MRSAVDNVNFQSWMLDQVQVSELKSSGKKKALKT